LISKNAIDKQLNESKSAPPYFQHGRPTTMFRAFALLTGSINIFSADLAIDTHNFRAYVDDNDLSSEL
jgi:hypothetical protein